MTSVDEIGQIPHLYKSEISKRVEELLDDCWDGVFPINIEKICDYLGVSVLPIRGLDCELHIDAFISSDFKTIYADEKEWAQESSRYRFSLAHELGHLVLHREYYSNRIDSFKEWQGFTRDISYDYVEYQANCFAANLLAPENELIRVLDEKCNGNFVRNCWDKSHTEFLSMLRNLQRIFMVSEQVVARRMRDTIFGADRLDEIARVIHNQ